MKALLLATLLMAGPAWANDDITHQDAAPLQAAQEAVDRGQWKTARQRLLPLAQKGNPVAQWALARLLELPTPVRNLKQALHWYTQLAQAGAPAAMEAAGLAHYMGRGTPVDLPRAADWFRQAGNAGEVGAQYILATMYEKGQGVPLDERLALSWYERAAASGDDAAKVKVRQLKAQPPTTPL
jgi:uncharacterized protein